MQEACPTAAIAAEPSIVSAVEPARLSAGETRHTFVADLIEVCRELWMYRELLYQFVLRDLRVRYKQSVMGFAWTIFVPAMVVLAGLVVKYAIGRLTASPIDVRDMFGLAIKALCWSFFVGSLNFATVSIVQNESLVTKNYFPREIFPISSVLAQMVDSAVAMILILLFLPWFIDPPALTWLWLIILLPLLVGLTSSMALLLSCANLFFRDVKYIVQVLLTFGIFFTPVFFEPSMFGETGSQLMMLNPLAPVMEGLRLTLVEGHQLDATVAETLANGNQIVIWSPWNLLYSFVCALFGLIITSVVFHRAEFLFAEYI